MTLAGNNMVMTTEELSIMYTRFFSLLVECF